MARKQANCEICEKPSKRVRLGMCHNCYHAWLRAGRPDRTVWEPGRRQWLRDGPPRKCLACGRERDGGSFRFGLDLACYSVWTRAGRPDIQTWVPRRRSWLEKRGEWSSEYKAPLSTRRQSLCLVKTRLLGADS
jgi:hypothetical protein